METGCEKADAPQAGTSRGMPDRPLGCYVDRIGAYRIEPPFNVALPDQRQADLRIARHGQGQELVRTEEFQFGAERPPLARHMSKRVDDAVDLRMPGIGGDKNLQAASALGDAAGASAATRPSWVQMITSNRPSWRSATAVHLSTQSPQLM